MTLYDRLAELYDGFFPVNPAFPARLESLVRGRRALDAGSATGAHVLALAGRGWDCLGIEPSERMVAIARREASVRNLRGARFAVGSMLDAAGISGGDRFDAVLCLGNTLPHLADLQEAERFFRTARGLMAPGAVLLLQLLNYDLAGPGFVFPELRSGGWLFRRRYGVGEEGGSRLSFETELVSEGEKDEERMADTTLLHPFRPAELMDALADEGFLDVEASSDWAGAPFDEALSPYLFIAARRT